VFSGFQDRIEHLDNDGAIQLHRRRYTILIDFAKSIDINPVITSRDVNDNGKTYSDFGTKLIQSDSTLTKKVVFKMITIHVNDQIYEMDISGSSINKNSDLDVHVRGPDNLLMMKWVQHLDERSRHTRESFAREWDCNVYMKCCTLDKKHIEDTCKRPIDIMHRIWEYYLPNTQSGADYIANVIKEYCTAFTRNDTIRGNLFPNADTDAYDSKKEYQQYVAQLDAGTAFQRQANGILRHAEMIYNQVGHSVVAPATSSTSTPKLLTRSISDATNKLPKHNEYVPDPELARLRLYSDFVVTQQEAFVFIGSLVIIGLYGTHEADSLNTCKNKWWRSLCTLEFLYNLKMHLVGNHQDPVKQRVKLKYIERIYHALCQSENTCLKHKHARKTDIDTLLETHKENRTAALGEIKKLLRLLIADEMNGPKCAVDDYKEYSPSETSCEKLIERQIIIMHDYISTLS
jgi:hypothetical protein